jgi:hypothetical protein
MTNSENGWYISRGLWHFCRRLWERYGIILQVDDIENIKKRLADGKATSLDDSHFLIRIQGKMVLIVTDRASLVTVLPPTDVRHPNAPSKKLPKATYRKGKLCKLHLPRRTSKWRIDDDEDYP